MQTCTTMPSCLWCHSKPWQRQSLLTLSRPPKSLYARTEWVKCAGCSWEKKTSVWDPGSKRNPEILVDHHASKPVQEQGEEEEGEGRKGQRQRKPSECDTVWGSAKAAAIWIHFSVSPRRHAFKLILHCEIWRRRKNNVMSPLGCDSD